MSSVSDKPFPIIELLRDIGRIAEDTNTFSDVTLISVDEVSHRASRLILAVRCRLFEKLFYDPTKNMEDDANEVRISASSNTLESALQFVYSGRAAFLSRVNCVVFMREQLNSIESLFEESDGESPITKKRNSGEDVPMVTEADVKHTISVAILSKDIGCLSLRNECTKTLVGICATFPQFSCTIFEAMYGENGITVEGVHKDILEVFEDSPLESFLVWHGIKYRSLKECVLRKKKERTLQLSELQIEDHSECGLGVHTLSAKSLKILVKALQKRGLQRSEYIFKVILCWVDGGDRHSVNGCSERELLYSSKVRKERKQQIKDVVAELDFLDMRKIFVAELVEDSGALGRDQLFTMYRKIALGL